MAGYIGSKAVTLSTTAADVAGNAVIDGDLTVKGTTVTIDSAAAQEIRLGDNDKMTFGDATGGDLQIYHDGTHSYVDENGTGQLKIRSNGTGVLLQTVSGENLATFANNAAVNLYYDNAAKFATTSTGIDVTGRITTDAITEDTSGNVGIGTSSPSTLMHISGSSASTDGIHYIAENTRGAGGPAGIVMKSNHGDWKMINSQTVADALEFIDGSAGSTRMLIDSSGNVGIGTTSPSAPLHVNGGSSGGFATVKHLELGYTASRGLTISTSQVVAVDDLVTFDAPTATYGQMAFKTAGSEAMRIDSSGNLLVGKTATGLANQGAEFSSTGQVKGTAPNQVVGYFNRTSSDGDILEFRKDNTTVGSIGVVISRPYIGNASNFGIRLASGGVGFLQPTDEDGAAADNLKDIGSTSARWDDIYATNGTIQTSDQNEKQDIAELSDAEQRVAVAAKGLLRKFRWKDKVAEKGDEARTHFGIIAQDLQAAFAAEGLDAGDYAMFIHTTWTDEETGEEKSRMGVRYSELLAFIIAAIQEI